MSLETKSKIYISNNRAVIYIPNSLLNDSQFPFKDSSTLVNMKIEDGGLRIEGMK